MFMSLLGMNIFTSLNHHLNEDFFFKFKKKILIILILIGMS